MTDYGSCLQVDPKLGLLSPAATDWGEIPYIKNIRDRRTRTYKHCILLSWPSLALGSDRLFKAFHVNPIILQSK